MGQLHARPLRLALLPLAVATALLAACGGGSDSIGGTDTTVSPSADTKTSASAYEAALDELVARGDLSAEARKEASVDVSSAQDQRVTTQQNTLTTGNRAPAATFAFAVGTEDSVVPPLTPFVFDPNRGDTHSFALLSQPGRGAVSLVNNRFVYTPDANFSGVDSFEYTATDAGGLSVRGRAGVVLFNAPDAPSRTRAATAVLSGTTAMRTPWVEDADLRDSFSFQILTQPSNGAAAVVNGQLVYTLAPGFVGTDSFAYRATDSTGLSVDDQARAVVYDSGALTECTRASTVNADGTMQQRTRSTRCARYSSVFTRTLPSGASVSMDYLVAHPSNGRTPKAVVVLIGGTNFDLNINGDVNTGALTSSGGNFLVRSAQLFAEAGYLAIALDRPTDVPGVGFTNEMAAVDQYRISPRHTVDIVTVLQRINTDNLPVFLAGTSKGALSMFANNLISNGIVLPSPVTSPFLPVPELLYVPDARSPNLQISYIKRPTLVMWNALDECALSSPAGSAALFTSLSAAGVKAASAQLSGGVKVTAPSPGIVPDVCGGSAYHGYLGIEPEAVSRITGWLDQRLAEIGVNRRPQAAYITVATKTGIARRIDLCTMTSDMDAQRLSYELTHGTTALGGSVSLNGGVVTYTPPAGVATGADRFVYVVTDSAGLTNAAVIQVNIAP